MQPSLHGRGIDGRPSAKGPRMTKSSSRSKRRAAEGVHENLAARDQRDSQRAAAPLMIPLGAKVINNSDMTTEQTSGLIIEEVRKRLAANHRT